MDAVDLILSFSTGTYTITRRAAGDFVRGRVVPRATTTLTMVASIQPATGHDLLRLPEARRSEETRVVYTTTQLYVGAEASAYDADIVTIDGEQWEVQHVETWRPGSTYDPTAYRCLVQQAAAAVRP